MGQGYKTEKKTISMHGQNKMLRSQNENCKFHIFDKVYIIMYMY